MAIDYVRGGSPRCPSLIVGGLMVICLFLACSWWSLTSQNFELLNQITTIEDQLKLSGDALDKCLSTRLTLEEKSKGLQSGVAQSRVKLEQLQTEEDELKESLTKTQEALEASKKKIAFLESSLTYKNTELDSLKTLGEAKNKTLEALRAEKKTLNTRLLQEEAKVEELRTEVSNLKKKPTDPVINMLQRGASQTYRDDGQAGIIVAGNHDLQAAQDENKAAEKLDENVADPPVAEKPGDNVDPREAEMARI